MSAAVWARMINTADRLALLLSLSFRRTVWYAHDQLNKKKEEEREGESAGERRTNPQLPITNSDEWAVGVEKNCR